MATLANVRNATFESNSSSSHAVVIAPTDIFDRYFSVEVVRNGVVNIVQEESGDYESHFRYYRPENILGFLIAGLLERGPSEAEVSDLRSLGFSGYDDWLTASREVDVLPILQSHHAKLDAAIKMLEDHTGMTFTMIVEPGKVLITGTGALGYMDTYFDNLSALKRLLFNSRSYVETTFENGWTGVPVDSDMGRITE